MPTIGPLSSEAERAYRRASGGYGVRPSGISRPPSASGPVAQDRRPGRRRATARGSHGLAVVVRVEDDGAAGARDAAARRTPRAARLPPRAAAWPGRAALSMAHEVVGVGADGGVRRGRGWAGRRGRPARGRSPPRAPAATRARRAAPSGAPAPRPARWREHRDRHRPLRPMRSSRGRAREHYHPERAPPAACAARTA